MSGPIIICSIFLNLLVASRYYINYSEENLAAIFSNIGYSCSPTFAATAGAMYFGEKPTPMMGNASNAWEKGGHGEKQFK